MSDDRRKCVFRIAAGVSFVGLLVGFGLAGRGLPITGDEAWLEVAVGLLLWGVIAALVGAHLSGWVGRRLSGRTTERLVKGRQPRREGGSAEIRSDMPRRFLISVLVIQFGFGAIHLVAGVAGAVGWWIFFLLLLALFVWWVRYLAAARPMVYADDEGITQTSFVLRLAESVPWDAVASCTIETATGSVFDESREAVCVFRDHGGNVLLRVALPDAGSEECIRFLRHIREYQGLQPAPWS